MFVDTDLLHSGGNQSHRAGGHARDGADQLAGGTVASGMFGDFAAADAFHSAVAVAHEQHVQNLQAHSETLTGVGTKAHHAANSFTNMDQQNATEMRALRPSSSPSPSNA
ncbi:MULTISPECIES: DUF2563 family protein [Mycobacterium avium complex (MAC)]|uniref:DUF2563 domain-containing protein n=1 Tax=Mycobacterium avium subsp. hominissuis TaxID=439334 RepID=A0AAI8ST25_MYCAV|nr:MULTISPECIES: DUF2563 family protein [Mycobacterium avium complex (MAC)]MBZ4512858.1 DUF2563 family protein [Mycobacterium avium subsp. hominissuis]MBZ4575099.1 DUF2563 family protein [Mycobacterium avium subsp. hominissuis]QBC87956.1 DUF2563 family protein [Mycobacterium avium subsp. hominissuis]QCR74628.1 DUF2563 family protein [Mycobacterium avium subsp. hominissuis]QCR79655.1 DUF2563 family protein [Mycobacterium avium subsp. hominissuis]